MYIQTPPMGFNTWNTFQKNIDEKLILETADIFLEKGYKDAGYEYVVIDDCWSLRERDENGRLVPDPEKFPHGMAYIADYLHERGLKFGMYSCAGYQTCAGFPGSYGYEYLDADTFASWGVDFLKYDFCFFPEVGNAKLAYLTMSNALRTCGRDILFSACNWGKEDPWDWMAGIGAHMYRSTGDIEDNFESVKSILFSQCDKFNRSGAGCFNDIDMLVCGIYGKGYVSFGKPCGDVEYKTHFALWCMFSAPLMIGGDIRQMPEYSHALMTNKNLIAINQDPDCRPPFEYKLNVWDPETDRIFVKLLSDGDYIIGIFNFSEDTHTLSAYAQNMGFPVYSGRTLHLTDVFTGKDAGLLKDRITVTLAPHDCALYRMHVTK